MLKTNLIKKLGSVTVAAALLISSQAFTFAQEETFTYPDLAASWDFSEATNSGFTVKDREKTPMSITLTDDEDKQGKMFWNTYILTADSYVDSVLEFDYKLEAEKPANVTDDAGNVKTWAEVRLRTFFGVADDDITSGNSVLIDFRNDKNGLDGKPRTIISTAEGTKDTYINKEHELVFNEKTTYNFRYAVNAASIEMWAKPSTETEYMYIGKRDGLSGLSGKMSIVSSNWGYIDNLKVYANKLKMSVNEGDYISADNAKFDVTLINDVEITNSNVMLKQNGSAIACTLTREDDKLTITPTALEANKTYTLWFSEEVSGEVGGKTVTFNTLPELAAYYDFATGTNNGFDAKTEAGVDTSINIENGEGNLWWERIPVTKKGYQNPVLDFDFSWNAEKDGRLDIWFGLENFGGKDDPGRHSYVDFNSGSNPMHFVGDDGDGVFSGFTFSKDTDYSIRYIIGENSVKFYAKTASDANYTYVGERNVSVPNGKIKIYSNQQFVKAKSIKVYANTAKVSVENGSTVSADLSEIKVTLPSETTVANDQFKLTQNGNKVAYTYAQTGNVLTIKPILKPQKTYVLWLDETVSGEKGGVTITFNTEYAVSAYYDFTKDVNSGFTVENTLVVENGEGKMDWNTNIITNNTYENAILDFDYRLVAHKDNERRLRISFSSGNTAYTDFTTAGSKTHFVDSINSDGFLSGGTEFLFKDNTDYSIRYIVSNDTVKLYAKIKNAADYTFVGARTGLNVGAFTISINSQAFGYISNLKVYGEPANKYDYVIKNATYDSTTKKFTADIISTSATGAKAAIASYSNNALTDVKIVDVTGTEQSVDTTLAQGNEYKMMVFESTTNLKPVAESVEFN